MESWCLRAWIDLWGTNQWDFYSKSKVRTILRQEEIGTHISQYILTLFQKRLLEFDPVVRRLIAPSESGSRAAE